MRGLVVAGRGGGEAAGAAMGVKLEVFRMLLYLSFPVSVFWVSNQGGCFEERVGRRRREIFPPDNPERRRQMRELKERLRRAQEGTR